MQSHQLEIPPPCDWQELQRIVTDYYKATCIGGIVEDFGRPGQAQDGIDTLVRNGKSLTGVQCKRVDSFSPKELAKELEKTGKLDFTLDHFVVVVTTKVDRSLQTEAIRLSKEKGIPVEVKFWSTFVQEVAGHENLFKKYFDFAARHEVKVQVDPSSALIDLEGEQSRYQFVVTKMCAFEKYKGDEDLVLVCALQGQKRATYHRLQSGHWTDFSGIVGVGLFDAYLVWLWISQFESFESIRDKGAVNSHIVLTKAECRRIRAEVAEVAASVRCSSGGVSGGHPSRS